MASLQNASLPSRSPESSLSRSDLKELLSQLSRISDGLDSPSKSAYADLASYLSNILERSRYGDDVLKVIGESKTQIRTGIAKEILRIPDGISSIDVPDSIVNALSEEGKGLLARVVTASISQLAPENQVMQESIGSPGGKGSFRDELRLGVLDRFIAQTKELRIGAIPDGYPLLSNLKDLPPGVNDDLLSYLRTRYASDVRIPYVELEKSFGQWSRIDGVLNAKLISQSTFESAAATIQLDVISATMSNAKGTKLPSKVPPTPSAPVDSTFSRHPDFLEYLEKAGRRAGHALSFEEVKQLAREWNAAHKNNSRAYVVVNESEFLKLALRSPYGSNDGVPRLSPTALRYFLTGEVPKGLTPEQRNVLVNGDLRLWKKYWDSITPPFPFTFDAFMKAINLGHSCVELRPGHRSKEGRDFVEIGDAYRMVSRRTGVGVVAPTITREEAERINTGEDYKPVGQRNYERKMAIYAERRREQEKLIREWREKNGGRYPTEEEKMHLLLGAEWDKIIRKLGAIPGKVYQQLTLLTREDAPYAYAALDFLGGILAAPGSLGKQGMMAFNDPVRYMRDVILNAPETAIEFLKALNVFDPNIGGPERFQRMLNALTLATMAKSNPSIRAILKEPLEVRLIMAKALTEVTPARVPGGRMSRQAGAVRINYSATPAEQARFARDYAGKLREGVSSLSEADPRRKSIERQAKGYEKAAEDITRKEANRKAAAEREKMPRGQEALKDLPPRTAAKVREILSKKPLTYGDLEKALKLLGFEPREAGTGSSHVSWKHRDGRVTTVSGHRASGEVGEGLRNKIMKDILWK